MSLQQLFETKFGSKPSISLRAPGRVNLIGEHTDYNEGFVFPAAIDRAMYVVATPTDTGKVHVYSADYDEVDEFSIEDISKTDKQWANYLRGVLAIFQQRGFKLRGFDAAIQGDVPQGAGLSSSAAYEVAIAALLNQICELGLDGRELALLAQRSENEFIGVQCGIMDQFISALGETDSALLIDCRSLDYRAVKLDLEKHGLAIVITNSGVRRGLVDSEYNARRSECEQGTTRLSELLKRKLNSLRDVTLEELLAHQKDLPEIVARRCKHVISENERVIDAVKCLEEGDLQRFGSLLNQSHASLRDDYEVSCKELDELVALTQLMPGVYGARMTGAGFGGCTVAVMKQDATEAFKSEVIPQYQRKTGKTAEVYVCKAVSGAASGHSAIKV